jgi:hypothetical protein
MNAKTSGGIACGKAKAGDAPPLNEQRRKRGAPLGNRNAWRHGKYAAARLAAHKASVMRVRGLGLIASALGLAPVRNRPLLPEQWLQVDQELRLLAWRAGLLTGMFTTWPGAWWQ